LQFVQLICIIRCVRVLRLSHIIRNSGKGDRIEIYPILYLYEETAGPFLYQRTVDRNAMDRPLRTEVQKDGRIRKWIYVKEVEKYLRIILLSDGVTVHNAFFDRGLRTNIMKIKYFTDTDTVLVEFSDSDVAQTKEINENIYVDLDEDDNLVSMTIEHASKQTNIAEVAYQQIQSRSA